MLPLLSWIYDSSLWRVHTMTGPLETSLWILWRSIVHQLRMHGCLGDDGKFYEDTQVIHSRVFPYNSNLGFLRLEGGSVTNCHLFIYLLLFILDFLSFHESLHSHIDSLFPYDSFHTQSDSVHIRIDSQVWLTSQILELFTCSRQLLFNLNTCFLLLILKPLR